MTNSGRISLPNILNKEVEHSRSFSAVSEKAGQNKGRRPRASSLEPGTLYICSECKYMSNNKSRYDAHFKQPRHVNQYRQRAYKEPKNRQAWLKVWFDKLEQAELENYEVFELTEEDGEEQDLINEDYVFRLPTASDIANARQTDRKISASSDFSSCSYGSTSSEG